MGNTGSHGIEEINLSDTNLTMLPLIEPERAKHIRTLLARRNRITQVPREILNLKRVTEISFRDNVISEFPLELCQLTTLTKLSLSFNRIRVIPKEIEHLKNLQQLSLEGNAIEELPQEIGQLESLGALDVQRNRLRTLPDSMKKLTKLFVLSLGKNQFAVFPPVLFDCASIKVLELGFNTLEAIPDEICKMTGLEELGLSCNLLKTLPENLFKELTNLRRFEAHTNQLKEIPSDVRLAKNLTRLNFAINQIKTVPSEVGALFNLEWLNLNSNSISRLPKSLGNMKSLKKLGLCQNQLLSLPQELVLLKKLLKIDVRRNQLSALPATARFFASSAVMVAEENPLLTETKTLFNGCNNFCISLKEQAARKIWCTQLKSILAQSASTEENDTENIDMELSAALENLEIPTMAQHYMSKPHLCHQCLKPYCREYIKYIDQISVPCLRSVAPVEFRFCSESCLKKHQSSILKSKTPTESTANTDFFESLRNHATGISRHRSESPRNLQIMTPSGVRSLSSPPVRMNFESLISRNQPGFQWLAFINGELDQSPADVSPESALPLRWLMERLHEGNKSITYSNILSQLNVESNNLSAARVNTTNSEDTPAENAGRRGLENF